MEFPGIEKAQFGIQLRDAGEFQADEQLPFCLVWGSFLNSFPQKFLHIGAGVDVDFNGLELQDRGGVKAHLNSAETVAVNDVTALSSRFVDILALR